MSVTLRVPTRAGKGSVKEEALRGVRATPGLSASAHGAICPPTEAELTL